MVLILLRVWWTWKDRVHNMQFFTFDIPYVASPPSGHNNRYRELRWIIHVLLWLMHLPTRKVRCKRKWLGVYHTAAINTVFVEIRNERMLDGRKQERIACLENIYLACNNNSVLRKHTPNGVICEFSWTYRPFRWEEVAPPSSVYLGVHFIFHVRKHPDHRTNNLYWCNLLPALQTHEI